jgi:LacI family transcriptional regulator
MPKANINDVADLAGVSIKTVSRVVNQEPNVRESTRAKVEKAIAELSYHPNQSARNLASQRARLIGLIYDDPSANDMNSAGYIIRLQQGALSACHKTHYELLIHPCDYRKRNIGGEICSLIEQTRPAGILLAAPLSNMPKIVRAIESTDTPLVKLSAGKDSRKDVSIATNDREVCAEMTRYLASLGHKSIAFIAGHESHKAVANRMLGYQDGLKQSGLNFSNRLVAQGDNSFGSGEICARDLLTRNRPPTAIFAANDDMAVATIGIAGQLGIGVPDQLSVAGFDDISLARLVSPKLTTIRQPLAKMAEHGASILTQGTYTMSVGHGSVIVPATLVIRESTGPAPGHNTS